MSRINPGDIGWIAYQGETPINVEFLGEEAGNHDRDYPYKPTLYFRLVRDGPRFSWLGVGEIVSESQREGDETILHATEAGAVREAIAYVQYWQKRELEKKNDYRKKIEHLQSALDEIEK